MTVTERRMLLEMREDGRCGDWSCHDCPIEAYPCQRESIGFLAKGLLRSNRVTVDTDDDEDEEEEFDDGNDE